MIENDQHPWQLIQLRQYLRQQSRRRTRLHRHRRERSQPLHPRRPRRARQVMNPEVKRRSSKRHRPLHRHRNMPRSRHRPQQHRRLNIIMIRQRYQPSDLQLVFNLPPLQIERQTRRQRRSPVAPRIIRIDPRQSSAALLRPPYHRLQHAPVLRQLRDKIQRLFRLIGMAMQRNARRKALRRLRFPPQVRNARLAHQLPPFQAATDASMVILHDYSVTAPTMELQNP